jgi:hypothetical protein
MCVRVCVYVQKGGGGVGKTTLWRGFKLSTVDQAEHIVEDIEGVVFRNQNEGLGEELRVLFFINLQEETRVRLFTLISLNHLPKVDQRQSQ